MYSSLSLLHHHLKTKLLLLMRVIMAATLTSSLSGCLLTSPFWNQAFNSHTDQVPLQAYTTKKNASVKFECSPAYHGGLYPPLSTPSWTLISYVTPSSTPMYDGFGSAVYSAAKKTTLPSGCWRQDPGNGVWYSSVRATQTSGSTVTEYNVFDQSGLACLGTKVGTDRNWFAWSGCQLTYSSGGNIPYVIFRASS